MASLAENINKIGHFSALWVVWAEERFCAKKVGHEIGLTLHVFLLLLFTKVAPVA